jgi:transcriptional regulator with XRE-family HTH domain
MDKPRKNELGDLLKQWRGARGRSQLEVSADSGISQRQISFIESGRSIPGRSTLMDIAQALNVPLRERNALLLAAGYAPLYSGAPWNSDEMKSISKALERMITQHEPYPAIVMDRYWNVLLTNDAAPRFFNCFIDLSARVSPRNMLHLMFDPQGMRPFVADWTALAKTLIQRVHQEAVGHIVDQKTRDLMTDLLAYPDVQAEWRAPERLSALPMIPMSFVKDGATMNYFSLITTVGTPQTIAAQELRVECLYPADDETEALHAKLLARAADLQRPDALRLLSMCAPEELV